jgi:indole-3-glycerol phosphate synthase
MSARVPTVLERILAETRQEVERRKRETPLPDAPARPRDSTRRPFRQALLADGVGVIAEFKRRSPSAGVLRDAPDLAEIVGAYARGGAVAVSVLTEGPNFGGALEDLGAARAACPLPLLRKDFILDPYQLHEARHAGADAVLLIVAALDPDELTALHAEARDLGLDVLVEVHDEHELAVALELGAEIVGVNNRDLRDFTVDTARTERLMERMPPGVVVVSESGIAGAEQLRRLGSRGVQAVLVGETLMRAEDPEGALRSLASRSLTSLSDAERTL